MTAIFASPARVVSPKITHRLTEVLNDVAAVEMDVFNQGAAVVTIKYDVLFFAGRPSSFHYDPNGVRWTHRSMWHVRWNKKRLTFPHQMVDDSIPFPDPDLDVALYLIKVFLRIDQVEIVPGIRPLDHHDKEVAAIIEILIADRRFELVSVF